MKSIFEAPDISRYVVSILVKRLGGEIAITQEDFLNVEGQILSEQGGNDRLLLILTQKAMQ